MTSLTNTAAGEHIHSTLTVDSNRSLYYHDRRHVLKFKPKCNKVLKRKLRKYRLRRDGKEDQDVLDVSETLISMLKIKSPNQRQFEVISSNSVTVGSEEPTPKNYLSKMVRRKQNMKTNNNTAEIVKPVEPEVIESTLSDLTPVDNIEKKQTNAFKLLMDSRNKSIGCNSPGKDKKIDEFESQDVIEKKSMKAKRQLVLQKMADAKGATKKREVEELREWVVKRKLEKRADKFKIMLLNKDPKPLEEKINGQNDCKTKGNKEEPYTKVQTERNVNGTVIEKSKTLVAVDIFDLTKLSNKISPEKKLIPKEDEEFLNKLSPSLRKKENMLCYFKKVDKEPDQDENNLIIKVKLTPKTKKKGKKKKLSLHKDTGNTQVLSDEKVVTIKDTTEASTSIDKEHVKSNEVGRKRKRKENTSASINTVINAEVTDPVPNNESRPKRNLRKPIKYNDDFLSSSDEELHIFTPKKKKHVESRTSTKLKQVQPNLEECNNIVKEKETKEVFVPKKPSKLAPIFAAKTQTDIAAIEAKQKFLQSGVPDKLKKIVALQKDRNLGHNHFLPVVHVQQLNSELVVEPSHSIIVPEIIIEDEKLNIKCEGNLFRRLLDLAKREVVITQKNIVQNTSLILQNMKQSYPKFPVYRTYHLLRDKSRGEHRNNNYKDIDNSMELLHGDMEMNNENPDRLSWTDKYKATSSNHIIGNFESIKELKKWLEHWTENNIKSKANSNANSDSSDFYASDVDSRDSLKSTNNLLIITGPVGSGKTSSVYAVASELAIKVIEVNASNKRTGKIMLQDLQEATQSHKVNRGNLGSDNSQKSQEIIEIDVPKKKSRGRPKKFIEHINSKKPMAISKLDASSVTGLSQEGGRTAMSLILIDDADIVFDQDDGFCSAIVQLVQSSKRPVILVTGTLGCPHLQRFIQGGKILKMNPLSPKVLGTWLDIMCLADNGVCTPGIGAKVLNYYKGDIRKTINNLQFYITTQVSSAVDNQHSQNCANIGSNMEIDETSSMSWADREVAEDINITSNDIDIIWKCFVNKQANLIHFRYPLKLFNLWWSLPCLLNLNTEKGKEVASNGCQSKVIEELNSIGNATDAISISDYLRPLKSESEFNITCQPWYAGELDSVSEQENLDSFHTNCETMDEIAHNIVNSSIFMAQKTLGCSSNTYINSPGMDLQRERDRISSRHNRLTGFLNPSAALDRRSLALDYWSSCRTICRVEKCKTDTNYKRNNRFCHYLKSLNVLCKNDYFDNLCNSLSPSCKSDMS